MDFLLCLNKEDGGVFIGFLTSLHLVEINWKIRIKRRIFSNRICKRISRPIIFFHLVKLPKNIIVATIVGDDGLKKF